MQTSESVHPEHVTSTPGAGQTTELGKVLDFRTDEASVCLHCEHGHVVITFPAETVLRFKVSTAAAVSLDSTIAISHRGSHARPSIDRHADGLVLRTSALQASVQFTPFSLEVTDVQGNRVYQLQSMASTGAGGWIARSHNKPGDHFYGLGEKTGFLDKQGEAYDMWNSDVYDPHVPEIDALYVSIPFLIHFDGSRATGVFLDNPGKNRFDMRTNVDSYDIAAATGDFDAYIFSGPTIREVIQQYTSLTGRIKMPPKWSIGYHQSRYSYLSQEEVLEVARTLRAKQIPCDAIYLDIHYMDGYRVFTFDQERFPDAASLTRELNEMGIRLVAIVDPGVKKDPDYVIYRDGMAKDVFCEKPDGEVFIGDVWPGPSAFPDFTDSKAADWWAEHQKFYVDLGISGIWNDMNEPAVFNATKTMDLDVMHRNDGNPVPHEVVHNLYGMLMCQATHAGLQTHLNGARPFVLTRSGYAGIQRYAAVWTGDNRSYWEHLALSIPMLLNLGVSGVPFSGVDIGGFAHHASGQLLARWTQVGVFFPFCRNHSALDTLRQEPWSFGSEVEEICRTYISLRYRWLPHLYTLFYESAVTGLPLVRPLVLEYPDDPQTHNLCDQFLLGRDILVAPVYRPDMNHRAVYLPTGGWTDYWTGRRLEGGQHILAEAPLDRLPLFIREGAILPEQAIVQSTAEPARGPLVINVYVGNFVGTTVYQLYDDDGETLMYQSGMYSLIEFKLTSTKDSVQLQYETLNDGYPRQHVACVHRFKGLETCPVDIEAISRPIGAERNGGEWVYDEVQRELVVSLTGLAHSGEIRFHKR